MMYSGKAITLVAIENGIVELNFDLQGESVNKFNRLTLEELGEALEVLKAETSIKGLLVTSNKKVFSVGADIVELLGNLTGDEAEIAAGTLETNQAIFNAVENLPFPTVTAINGYALGGGLEMALTTDYRVMSQDAKIGLPETKLGIVPGFGGTVRLPRIVGVDNAVEWIAGGAENKADVALAAGAVDAVVEPELVREAALDILYKCIDGTFNYEAKREEKLIPLKLNETESLMAFETSKAFVAGKAGPHYPAPVTAIKAMQKAATLDREGALEEEAKAFAKMIKTSVSKNLIGLFLGDQELGKNAKAIAAKSEGVKKAAVLGAGIMGGGIAYQSAYKGTPIIMKDIAQEGIDLGLKEASTLLSKRVSRGRMAPEEMAGVLNQITPSLSYDGFDNVDLVVEAVVENPAVKQAVLATTEGKISENMVLASNTSTISINYLAEALKRPENFCGMHFFNPVHKMPLVEVIRGEKTSDDTVARTVAYALAMGKKPVVVEDCPGFLVNRILYPYILAAMELTRAGADFSVVDKVMEKFGWPMGPSYLADVVGLDTGAHVADVIATGFPDRMALQGESLNKVLLDAGRLGQKSGKGLYSYEPDKKGRIQKVVDEQVWELLTPYCEARREFTSEEIIDRLMIPLCIEAVRCLEKGIAATAVDVDMSLIYGLGFPPFRGGALHYIEDMGIAEFVAKADQYANLGVAYQVTDRLREMSQNGDLFFK